MNHAKSILVAAATTAAIVSALCATVASAASQSKTPSHDDGTIAAGPCFDQGNMAAALSQLRAARASLANAEHNKGGWRDNAIKSTDAAIAEATRGCAMPK